MGLKKETLLEDMKTNNKTYRKVSVKLQYDEIKLLENKISLIKKFIKINEELIELGY